MSRCFPYPPPGYCRNGASYEALIESIKLQKETDKAKAERKKEKRAKKEKKEKKEKEKRKNDEKVKLQKNQSQESHKLQKDQINGTKANTEILEKSDLTEELGQPINPSYSSDSTQNSNKRRRDDDALLPDGSPSHGKAIKIRFFKKQKGSDSSNSGEDARLKLAPLVQQSSYRINGVSAISGRENNTVQKIPLTQTKTNTGFENLGGERISAKPVLPSGSRKSDTELLKSTRQQQQIANFIRPVVPHSPHLAHEIPSSSASRNIGVQWPNSGRQQQGPTNLKPVVPIPGSKPNLTTTGKRPIDEISVPGTSGPTKPEKKMEVGPSRSEKKMMKKKAKYEKLIGSWVPPPIFQALLPDVDEDEDWLSRRTKPANSSVPRGEVESCRESAETSLWQPRARYLAEADIYALPYTVPF